MWWVVFGEAMVLRWMQCCLWALWKQQSICRLQQQGHRQDVWEVVNDDHYYFLLIFCLFVCSAQLSSSIWPGRVSVCVVFFFLPLVNNAVTYAQSHLYFHCPSLLTKGLGTGLVHWEQLEHWCWWWMLPVLQPSLGISRLFNSFASWFRSCQMIQVKLMWRLKIPCSEFDLDCSKSVYVLSLWPLILLHCLMKHLRTLCVLQGMLVAWFPQRQMHCSFLFCMLSCFSFGNSNQV